MSAMLVASLARQESAFLWPWPALSLLPPSFLHLAVSTLSPSACRGREEGGWMGKELSVKQITTVAIFEYEIYFERVARVVCS